MFTLIAAIIAICVVIYLANWILGQIAAPNPLRLGVVAIAALICLAILWQFVLSAPLLGGHALLR